MMKTPKPTDKKTYVHEKVVADPVAGKKLIKKIRGNVKKTIKRRPKMGLEWVLWEMYKMLLIACVASTEATGCTNRPNSESSPPEPESPPLR